MKRAANKKSAAHAIALALTWDGARWPVRALPIKARAFLTGKLRDAAVPSARRMAELLAKDQVKEIRICWVPHLKGGDAVLSEPFQTATGTRLAFRTTNKKRFGDVLGVIYRR